jgi:hypothetical protein
MNKTLFFLMLTFLCAIATAQSYIGVGSGVYFNQAKSIIEGHLTDIEIVNKSPKIITNISFYHDFFNRYQQEIRLAYKEVSYDKFSHIGDYIGRVDTAKVSLKSLDFINLHNFKLLKSIPVYLVLGVNLTKVTKLNINNRGMTYNFGPGGNINDSTAYINIYNYSTIQNPKIWGVGTIVGLRYSKSISQRFNLRLEGLIYNELESYKMIEDIKSRSLQINLGLSYLLKNKNNTSPVVEDDLGSERLKDKTEDILSVGYAYAFLPKFSNEPKLRFSLNYLRQVNNGGYYIGGGVITVQKNVNTYYNTNETYYFIHLSGEYRFSKFLSIDLNPGLRYINDAYLNSKIGFGFNTSLNLNFRVKEIEFSPFTQFSSFPILLSSGLKLRFRF